MLRSKVFSRIDGLGLAHLADNPMTVFRHKGVTHLNATCPQARLAQGAGFLEVTPRTLEGEACSCMYSFPHGFIGRLFDAEEIVDLVSSLPRSPLPRGNSVHALVARARRANQLESVISRLTWLRLVYQPLVQVRDQLVAELQAEVDQHVPHLRRHGRPAALRHAAVLKVISPARCGLEEVDLKQLVGDRRTHLLLTRWYDLVTRDTTRDERRRHLSALVGSFFASLGEDGNRSPVRERVLAALAAFSVLEDRLEVELDRPVPLVLASFTYSRVGNASGGGPSRLVLEAFTVAEHGDHRLLAIPKGLLWEVTGNPDQHQVALPNDPALLETAAGLWDPGAAALSDLESLVQAAELV